MMDKMIYHELCHIDLENKLPNLHYLHKKSMDIDDDITCFTIMIYIEYLAHLKSTKLETSENQIKFYESINQKKWNFNNEIDKIYFIKYAPYIIGRDLRNEYILKLDDSELKKHIEEVKKEFEKLPIAELIDNYNILGDLEKLVKKYISNN